MMKIMEQVGMASQNLSEITVSLKNILGALERGEGLMGQMINDPEFGKQGLDAFRGALQNLEALTGDLRRGEGFVGRLLHDEEVAGPGQPQKRQDQERNNVDKFGQSGLRSGLRGHPFYGGRGNYGRHKDKIRGSSGTETGEIHPQKAPHPKQQEEDQEISAPGEDAVPGPDCSKSQKREAGAHGQREKQASEKGRCKFL